MNDGALYPSVADTSAKLSISYLDGNQQKTITDLHESNGFYESSMIIARSWDLDNPEFTLSLNDVVLTKIRFETFMNNAKCQGWPTVSKVYENGRPTGKTENRFYILGSK